MRVRFSKERGRTLSSKLSASSFTAERIGSVISGGESCAYTEPLLILIIEWITDCLCIVTSISFASKPKRKPASITSSPLFASVAESMEIFLPIFQVGCFTASCHFMFSRFFRPRKGPPDAVITSDETFVCPLRR